jgi:hypothetical protein
MPLAQALGRDSYHTMSNDRASRALARIDAALARIEALPPRGPVGDPEMAARYAKLRAAAEAAASELDALIAGHAR